MLPMYLFHHSNIMCATLLTTMWSIQFHVNRGLEICLGVNLNNIGGREGVQWAQDGPTTFEPTQPKIHMTSCQSCEKGFSQC